MGLFTGTRPCVRSNSNGLMVAPPRRIVNITALVALVLDVCQNAEYSVFLIVILQMSRCVLATLVRTMAAVSPTWTPSSVGARMECQEKPVREVSPIHIWIQFHLMSYLRRVIGLQRLWLFLYLFPFEICVMIPLFWDLLTIPV